MDKIKTILATAYAVNPYKGSEDGMGWNGIYQIARFNKVIAITRENNQVHIEKYMLENPDSSYDNIQFLYFDLPKWMRFWKKKSRGAMLYYWMWQRSIPSFVVKQKIKCDIVHNLNFHNDWTPSYLHKVGLPFVWGPIGHHPLIPAQYLKPYDRKYIIKNRLTWSVKKLFWNYSRGLKQTISNAKYILCMNSSVVDVISLSKTNFSIIPSVATEDYGYNQNSHNGKFKLISVGRLVPLKGFDLSISAFAKFIKDRSEDERKECELIIVGSGPEKLFLQNLAKEKTISQYVKFIDWIERSELLEMYNHVSVFLFPSHEGAGMVVAEALSFGLPVICLDNCGPGEFIDENCGFSVPEQDYNSTVKELSLGISKLFENPFLLARMSKSARQQFEHNFNWNKRGEQFQSIYKTF
ncbi:MAG: glycosyltransferase involved in cell wall biosynthesis [Saprospiraceae bacterium]|jgi:glycosyltransferase involved in cell wall biosynthesis